MCPQVHETSMYITQKDPAQASANQNANKIYELNIAQTVLLQ